MCVCEAMYAFSGNNIIGQSSENEKSKGHISIGL